ncbi:hypothetical protein Mapa_003972 [Marchantia paleacea]|nr:hypothetical protein Mapa_003972 [Marchantia paleacea]
MGKHSKKKHKAREIENFERDGHVETQTESGRQSCVDDLNVLREVRAVGEQNVDDTAVVRVKGEAVHDESNNYGLESSSLRKKSKTRRRDREIEQEKNSLTSAADEGGVKLEAVSDDLVDHHDMGLSAVKKRKKVRFQIPESEERKQEEAVVVVSEKDEQGEKENLSLARDENGSEEDERGEENTIVDENYLKQYPASLLEDRGWQKDQKRLDLKNGFFSEEEDEKIRNAVYAWIRMKNLDKDVGVRMLFSTKSHPEARGAWLDIARCLPERSVKLIYTRAERLLGGHKRGKWSEEELQQLRELREKYGNDWKTIAQYSERSGQLMKDKWRYLRLETKKGKWTDSEYNLLCAYVRWSLRIKEKIGRKKNDRRILRDDINWEIISEKLLRPSAACANVWYARLASPLVNEGRWANGDDRRLLQSLLQLGASSEEAVDWDRLLNDRDGVTCETRWNEMKRLLWERYAPFEDKLEQSIRRFAPDLIGLEEEVDLAFEVKHGYVKLIE